MGFLVPVFTNVMMDNSDHDWGPAVLSHCLVMKSSFGCEWPQSRLIAWAATGVAWAPAGAVTTLTP